MSSRRTTAAARATQRRQSAAVCSAPPPVDGGKENGPDNGRRMLVVGIGASAGGLEAFTQLLKHLPLDTGMAFVLVQHLDPDHESALTQILSRATAMPVSEVAHKQRLQANHVYIIPRDTNLGIWQGLLQLGPRARTRTPHRPIDVFFESLAQDQRERAVGVVLSGTASDGTLGLEAIKAVGGITFAQDDSAKYDSMPRSAVAAGCVDLVLSPSGIATELARIAKHPSVAARLLKLPSGAETEHEHAIAHQDDGQPLPSGGRETAPTGGKPSRGEAEQEEKHSGKGAGDGYQKIMLLLRNHSGVDFSLYKPCTIRRRITRRMVLTKQDRVEDYTQFLRGNAEELDALFSDVLISVTSFFRNPEVFEALKTDVLPKLLAQRGDDSVRCWVLGCSTGQEAYSLAMAFVEAARKVTRARTLQVFATDLNEKLLEKARHGLYAKALVQDISPERLREFFIEEDGGYRINKALREMVVFARQNLMADPPFSRMDLISCRNLLIYFEPGLQQKALPTFHYALKPHGYLLLGASESVGGFTDLFEPVDRKHKIFSKKPAPTPRFHMPVRKEPAKRAARGPLPSLPIGKRGLPDEVEPLENFRGELNAQREADRIAVSQFAPPGVLINDALQVLQFRGPTGAYLEPPAGKASFDVLKMAREGLMLPLRAAINQARQGNKTVRTARVRVTRDGVTRAIHVAVIPLKNLRERCFLVVFEEADKASSLAPPRQKPAARPLTARQESHRVAELEADLSESREYLQSVQEQQEAAHEELQAANEEVQSANEELQSINEELETSKEELESANEELTTVNEEMMNRNVDLHRLNNDLVNFQASTKLAIMLLGRDLTVRRFSPQAEKQFDLLAADVGRPINHIRHNLVATGSGESPLDLEALAGEVIADVREQEREVRDKGGRWHSLRVRPYLTLDNKVDGAVLVLVDIDAVKRSEQIVAAARELAEDTLETVREPLLVLDGQLRVERANRAFYRVFQVAPAETIGRRIYDLGNRQWDIPRLRELLEQIQPHRSIEEFLVEHAFEHLGHRTMLLDARCIEDSQNKTERILLAIEDITERTQAETLRARLAAIVESSEDAILGRDLAGIITSWNQGAQRMFGYSAQEALGQSVSMLIPSDREGEESYILDQIKHGEPVKHFETFRRRKDGSLIGISLTVSPIKDAHGRLIGVSKVARDISARELLEAAMRQNEAVFSTILEQAPVGMYLVNAQFCVQQVNSLAQPVFSTVKPLIGRDFSEVIKILWGPEVGGQITDILRHTLETGEPYISPGFSNRRYDLGVEQSYHWETRRVTLADGQWGVVCYFTDITERKRVEAELEQRVADRTQELTQLHEQLRALTTELNLAEQRERRRLATELHDHLAQLLVLGKMKLGQSKRLTLSAEKRDELIEETDAVLSEALAYTRTLVIDLSPPILHEFGLPAALRWLGERMQRHGLAVTVRIETEDLSLPEDGAVLLFQSARELLINTAKHAGVGIAWVSLEQREGTLQIEVRDEGVGFNLAAAAAAAAAADGSIMAMSSKFGLFSIRERMQALGGSFEVQSAPGAGTTATLRLPLAGSQARGSRRAARGAVQEASEVTGVASVSPPSSPSPPSSAHIRVLLVDDHAMVRQGLRTLLDSYPDVEVVGEACNGEEAVAFVERVQPSIVVMDINMPKMNGIDATAAIVSRYPGTVVIGLSVQAGGDNEEAMRKAGAAMLLTKEAAVDELYQAIRESLDVRLKGNVLEQCVEPAPPNS